MRPGYAVTNKNLQIVLNTPKNPYLKQAKPPPPKKKPGIKNFQTQKKSFDHPRYLKSGVPRPPLGLFYNKKNESRKSNYFGISLTWNSFLNYTYIVATLPALLLYIFGILFNIFMKLT